MIAARRGIDFRFVKAYQRGRRAGRAGGWPRRRIGASSIPPQGADASATEERSGMQTGVFNPGSDLAAQGIGGFAAAHYNLEDAGLMQAAVRRGEGEIGRGGALLVETGRHTGRSPKDKFVVREPSVEPHVWWDNNAAMEPEAFERLLADMTAHVAGRELFVQDLYGGADPDYRLNVRVTTELARHGCRSETVIAISFERKMVLIGGTSYAGENKKSVFTLLNYLLPERGVMPMHCSANHAKDDPDDSAVFFGLSGTGKTTLSADPDRVLIGDDEHGWSDKGIFNFEGGCYAKTIDLSPQAEPEIFATTGMFATVIENMVYDPQTRALDFADDSLTPNMRCAYPLHYISNASETGLAGAPRNVVMLTCDAFGVLPPIARLTPAQAMYHFLSGFTAKVAGTERGVTEPQPTFSTCFGAPFMPRRPEVYGNLLRDKIAKHGATCWLVNTGWTGGAYGTGSRMPIKATRALLTAALDGSLNKV